MTEKKGNSPFQQRLEAHQGEMHQIYMELYHDENAYSYFCQMLQKMYTSRRACLKAIDKQRQMEPDWYKRHDRLGMQIYTQCFGGTLKGVQSHLDYIQNPA